MSNKLKYGIGDVVKIKSAWEYDLKTMWEVAEIPAMEVTISSLIFVMGDYYDPMYGFEYIKDNGERISGCFTQEEITKVVFSRKYKIGQSVRAFVYNNNVKTEEKTRFGVITDYKDDKTALIRFGLDKCLPIDVKAIADKFDNSLEGYKFGSGRYTASLASKVYEIYSRDHDCDEFMRDWVQLVYNTERYWGIVKLEMKNNRLSYTLRQETKKGVILMPNVRMSEIR